MIDQGQPLRAGLGKKGVVAFSAFGDCGGPLDAFCLSDPEAMAVFIVAAANAQAWDVYTTPEEFLRQSSREPR